MKHYLTSFILLLFIFQDVQSQISVDSLRLTLDSDYTKTGERSYLMETFSIFESADKLDRYDLMLDSSNQLQEYIGLSIVHYAYDEQKRPTLIEGFNRNGERSYWDFPVVQRFTYTADTVVSAFNQLKNDYCDCQHAELLSSVQESKEVNLNPTYNKTRYHIYSSDSTMKLTYAICSTGKLCNRGENVAYVFRVFDKEHHSTIVHERYYDNQLQLVDGLHSVFKSERLSVSPPQAYAYSERELTDGKITLIRYYNSKKELVHTENYGNQSRPINGTTYGIIQAK